jgi:protein SCO1/2
VKTTLRSLALLTARLALVLSFTTTVLSEEPPPPAKPACCATNLHAAASCTDKSLYQVDSTWLDDNGRDIKLSTLRGRVQIVTMFYARCQVACPILVHDMKRVEAALSPDLRAQTGFTLLSMDSERDTPGALRAWRKQHDLPSDRWTLVNGKPDDVQEMAALLGVKFKKDALGQFSHSNLITVLDPNGEIVFQYSGLNQEIGGLTNAIERAIRNAKR